MKIAYEIKGKKYTMEVFNLWSWELNKGESKHLVTHINTGGMGFFDLLVLYYDTGVMEQVNALTGINSPWFAIVGDMDDNLFLSWIYDGLDNEGDIFKILESPMIPIEIIHESEEDNGDEFNQSIEMEFLPDYVSCENVLIW